LLPRWNTTPEMQKAARCMVYNPEQPLSKSGACW
jgi:hypothetical protein